MESRKRDSAKEIIKPFSELDDQTRASKLLDAMLKEDLPPYVKEILMEWFHGDINSEGKDRALEAIIEQFQQNENPGMEDVEALEGLNKLTAHDGGSAKRLREQLAQKSHRTALRRWPMRVAAVMIPAILAVGVWMWMWGGRGEQFGTPDQMVAVADSIQYITLPDGSTVILNAAGTIAYNDDFSKERLVTIDGEAYFSVVKDGGKPFRVKAKDMTVEVLGTEFNINSYSVGKLSEVVLVKGSVEITTAKGDKYPMTHGERLTIDIEGKVDTQQLIAENTMPQWKRTEMTFDDTPIEKVFKEVSDQFGMTIIVDSGVPRISLINMSFRSDATLEYVMDMIEVISKDFSYRIEGDKIIVSPNI